MLLRHPRMKPRSSVIAEAPVTDSVSGWTVMTRWVLDREAVNTTTGSWEENWEVMIPATHSWEGSWEVMIPGSPDGRRVGRSVGR